MNHYLDISGEATRKGNWTERHFERALIRNHMNFTPATREEQRHHFDYIVNEQKVEVKSDKNISRNDTDSASRKDMLLLELAGYQEYNKGWLHGNSDLIAFQLYNDMYLLFARDDLLRYANSIKSSEKIEYEKPPKLYQQYYRSTNPNESFIWVKISELMKNMTYRVLK